MNKPITLEEMKAYVDATWKKCQSEAWGEPVAWIQPKTVDAYLRPDLGYETCSKSDYGAFPVYTAPSQRKPLTDEEIWLEYQRFWPFHPSEEPALAKDIVKFARAIEAAHNIKEPT